MEITLDQNDEPMVYLGVVEIQINFYTSVSFVPIDAVLHLLRGFSSRPPTITTVW